MRQKEYNFMNPIDALDFMADWAAQNNMPYSDDEYDEIKARLLRFYKEPRAAHVGDFVVFDIYQEKTSSYFYTNKNKRKIYYYEFIIKRDA